MEAKLIAMEEFKVFEELKNIEIQFASEAYDAGFNTCHRSSILLDLDFLKEDIEDDTDPPQIEANTSTISPPNTDPSVANDPTAAGPSTDIPKSIEVPTSTKVEPNSLVVLQPKVGDHF